MGVSESRQRESLRQRSSDVATGDSTQGVLERILMLERLWLS